MDFAVPADYSVKKRKSEKRDEYVDLSRELKKMWNLKVTIIPILSVSWYIYQISGKRTRRLGNNGTGEDCPNDGIIEIGQNTEKSPGDLRRLAVTQPPVENQRVKE